MKQKIREFFISTKLIPKNLETSFDDNFDLIENGIVESFNVISIVVFLETQFNIKFSSRDLSSNNFKSINTIAHFVEQKIREQNER